MIQLFHIYKNFGANIALNDINLRVHEGEFVFVTGPSGAGKTTLLRLIFGAERPAGGHILINGINLSRISRTRLDLLRRKIGFVFQSFNLIAQLSIVENIEVPLFYQGVRRHRRRKRSIELAGLVGLGDRLEHHPGELSGGEQQRVAIARALANDPMILLADEPTGNLDSSTSDEILAVFDELHRQGRTIVMVTHEQSVAQHAQRCIHLRDGLVESDGPCGGDHVDR